MSTSHSHTKHILCLFTALVEERGLDNGNTELQRLSDTSRLLRDLHAFTCACLYWGCGRDQSNASSATSSSVVTRHVTWLPTEPVHTLPPKSYWSIDVCSCRYVCSLLVLHTVMSFFNAGCPSVTRPHTATVMRARGALYCAIQSCMLRFSQWDIRGCGGCGGCGGGGGRGGGGGGCMCMCVGG